MPRTSGGFYDRFRDRIIFPIFDRQSRVVAFGGRSIGKGEPKYLNSPESQLYSKGRTLYGLPQASEALRLTGVALVVEGYLDLIALQVQGHRQRPGDPRHRPDPGAGAPPEKPGGQSGPGLRRRRRRGQGHAAGLPALRPGGPAGAGPGPAGRAWTRTTTPGSQGVEIFTTAWDSAQPWFTFLLEGLIATHGLEVEGRVRILEELRPYFQAITEPVEQELWLKTAAQRLGVDEGVLRRSLASFGPITARRLSPAAGVAVSLEKGLLRWVLGHPEAVALEELEEWALEFDAGDLKELLDLVIESYRQHGKLDHGLLVQQVERDNLRQQICALTLAEEEASGPQLDLLIDHWRRDLKVRRLKKARARLKERLRHYRPYRRRRPDDLAGSVARDRPATERTNRLYSKRRKWMNKGIGMDGFQEIMPMGDDDTLITVDDLNDSLSPESLLNEQMKDHPDL